MRPTGRAQVSAIGQIGGSIVLLLLIAGIVILARPKTTPSIDDTGIPVVAAENVWGNIAAQLGDGYIHVTSIITSPTADPHLYEATAQDAAAVTSARVVIENGVGYDDFMHKLVNASRSKGQQVLNIGQVLGVAETANQHIWYDIPRLAMVARSIVTAFSAADPTHTSDFQHELIVFDQSLQPLLQTTAYIKQRYAGAPVAYTEPVPGYLLDAAGLTVKTPAGFAKSIEDGNEPAPADTQAMEALLSSRAIKVLLYNAQATSPVTEHIKQLAGQAGIPVIGVTETLPSYEASYQTWQHDQLNQLLHALQGL